MAISTIGTDALASAAVTSAKLASGAPSTSQLPAGTVLQVVNAAAGSTVTISSGQATPTAWQTLVSASITPTSSSSKILILWNAGWSMSSGNTWCGCGFAVFRNTTATQIGSVYGLIGYDTSAALNHRINECPGQTIDTPGVTTSTTYLLAGRAENGNGQTSAATAFSNYAPSLITLIEIAA